MSLVQLSDYKTALGITGTGEDTKISQYSLEVETRVKNYIGRNIELTFEIEELYDGDGGNYLMPKQWPVYEISSVQIYDGQTGGVESWDTWVLDTDYDRLLNRGSYIYVEGAVFPEGTENIKLTYDAGYEIVPDDIQNACKKLMVLLYKKIDGQLLGMTTKSTTVGASSADAYDLDEEKILREIAHYRTPRL